MCKENSWPRWLRPAFWSAAIVLGLAQAWAARFAMDPDGISYLDMGDAYLRRDWNMAINSFWSPVYPWLLGLALAILKPSPYWEFPVVHLVNWVVYLGALACFEFFLAALINERRGQTVRSSGEGLATVTGWEWFVLGYALFIWSSLVLIGTDIVAPDMCVAAFVYLACGLLLRIRGGSASWLAFALLGTVLGFGYLAKGVMLPLAFVFLAVAVLSVGDLRRALPRFVTALAFFLAIASPLIVAISVAKGRLTLSETGKLNYAAALNDIPLNPDQQRKVPDSTTPRHPVRKIFDMPAAYEFGTPIGGTYPPWYDPSYWNEGVEPRFNLRRQVKVLAESAIEYYDLIFRREGGLIAGLLILFFMAPRRWSFLRDIGKNWHLLFPAVAALGLYALVHVELRYLGPFVVLLWVGLFSGVCLPNSQESRRLISCAVIVIAITYGTLIIFPIVRDLVKGRETPVHCEVAHALSQMGIQPGDKIAYIGNGVYAFWARLARVRIIAEVPAPELDDFWAPRSSLRSETVEINTFWAASPSVQSQVVEALAKTGVKVIVAERLPNFVSTTAWQRLGNTDYYVYAPPR